MFGRGSEPKWGKRNGCDQSRSSENLGEGAEGVCCAGVALLVRLIEAMELMAAFLRAVREAVRLDLNLKRVFEGLVFESLIVERIRASAGSSSFSSDRVDMSG